MSTIWSHWVSAGGAPLVRYLGQLDRRALLAAAASAHVGLAFMPCNSGNINMRNMTGASNKSFDYMAANLALLVSDLPDWVDMFVRPSYARSCDPVDAGSITAALDWFLKHPDERRDMAARGQQKIATEWNYDRAFAPIIDELKQCAGDGARNLGR